MFLKIKTFNIIFVLILFVNKYFLKIISNQTNQTMKKLVLFAFAILTTLAIVKAQDQPIGPTTTGVGVYHGLSQPLRDIPAISTDEFEKMELDALKPRNPKLETREYPFADKAFPKGDDPIWQNKMGFTSPTKAPIVNFDGQTSPYYPPDCNGDVGPQHYFQTINSVYCIYNKNGTIAAGPANMNTLFTGVTGATCNDGDPLVFWDEQVARWVAVEFSICGANDYMLFAVSQTSDPTGAWHRYSFDVDDMPDYEKVGVWQDGYYMGTNTSGAGKKDIYVFDRSKMINGQTAGMVGFDNPWRPTTIDGFMCVPPVDNDGPYAPAGSPGIFITLVDDAIAGTTSDQLWIYELDVDWVTPANSTFVRTQQLTVPAFDSNFGNNWTNIKQPGTTQELDAIPMVIMNAPQYRNFGSYQTLVCCHTVDVDATDHAGIRWYELRKTSSTWSVRQSGTYAPDAHSRWMGSVKLNGQSEIGLAYSISSSTLYPGIRYTGQTSANYNLANGQLDLTEQIIQTGAYSQTAAERWGDYASLNVDPSDDKTFWFTTEYIGSGGARKTKIASFQVGSAVALADLVVNSTASSPASVQNGQTTTASCTVLNQGTVAAAASNVKYYLSTDNVYNTGDIYLATDAVASLAASASANVSELVTIPANTSPGTYFILFFADADLAVTEANENNNVGSVQITVTSSLGQPDLTVTNPTVTPVTVLAGQTVTASCTVSNLNPGPSSTASLKYYLSTNTVYDAADTYLATDAIGTLAGSGSINLSEVLTIPGSTPASTRYILFFADADLQVAETNETNNVSSVAITITAPQGCNSTTQYPSTALTPTTAWKSQKSIWAGEYTTFNVTSGRVYHFSYCSADGATASYDSELTLRNKTTDAFIAYSDDACGDDAKIIWTATFTGQVKLVTTLYGCGTNSTNSTLRYKYTTSKEAGEISEENSEKPSEYSVYPSPTSGIIYVEAASGFETIKQISVYNITGQLVKKIDLPSKPDNVYGIDLSGNPAGLYIVKIVGSEVQEFNVLLTN